MCAPVLLPIVAIAATTAIGAASQSAAAEAQANALEHQGQTNKSLADYNAEATENASNYNADVIEQNAIIYEEAAVDALERGVAEAAAKRQEFKQANARGRAALASSGTQLDTGTNLELLVNNAGFGEINALAVVNNAEREGYGYLQESTNLKNQAAGVRYTGDLEATSIRATGDAGLVSAQYAASNARFAGKLAVGETIIGGATSAFNLFPKTFRSGGGN